ncbi:unnamed protein product [Dicrocoelium dendriticum]|nr:unnamed protein product [Dicrocoelium dendriticum]
MPPLFSFLIVSLHYYLRLCSLPIFSIRTMGSAALHICQVAAGSGDAFFEFGIHCWDYAAAMLIVREAGGYCCNYDGSPVDLMARNIVCAGTPELAKAVCSIIQPIHYVHD